MQGRRVCDDVAGDDRVVGVAQMPFSGPSAAACMPVDLIDRGGSGQLDREVRPSRLAPGSASRSHRVSLAARAERGDRLGRTGGGRHHMSRRPGPAQIWVRRVLQVFGPGCRPWMVVIRPRSMPKAR